MTHRYVKIVVGLISLGLAVACGKSEATMVPSVAVVLPSETPVPSPVVVGLSTATSIPSTRTRSPTYTPVAPTATTQEKATSAETATATPMPADPFMLISQESLFAYLEDLTAIQPHSGWRNSASVGEAEALEYVAERLGTFGYLRDLGLELERQGMSVFMGTELWETKLIMMVDGEEIEVPADGLRGPRDDIAQALRFDSDGALNDRELNPVVVKGEVILVRSVGEIDALRQGDVRGKVVFLDYAAIDKALLGTSRAVEIASELLAKEPAGLVLVTQFSNEPGESHGFGVADVSALNWVRTTSAPPTLYVRLEDLTPAGINDWDDFSQVQTAWLTWDADVFSPANSGNLVARIPGEDSSKAVILSAHIDSPNNPGAMDDGSGSVVLLEVARVLDAARRQPGVDLYLAWFGSEELSLYGSSHFVATHQELLDRTLAMLSIDDLTYPLEGIDAELELYSWSYARVGDERLLWPDYLTHVADQRDIRTVPRGVFYFFADNGPFGGFDVPNADLFYGNEEVMNQLGYHYAGHIHDPYDTVELAREVGDVLVQMAHVALAAGLVTGEEAPDLRVSPRPDRRALFVASHTEAVSMAAGGYPELGMALAMQGFDVDVIPYGEAVTSVDLEAGTTDLVVVLPVVDYPSREGNPDLYDEAWSEAEVDVLEAYVAEGGLLLLTNSAHRLKHGNRVLDLNEDWSDVNALAVRFGVSYHEGALSDNVVSPEGDHMLMEDVSVLEMAEDNGVPFTMRQGQVLAQTEGATAVGLVGCGDAGGQVLVLADVAILGSDWGDAANLAFWRNLAQYARSR